MLEHNGTCGPDDWAEEALKPYPEPYDPRNLQILNPKTL